MPAKFARRQMAKLDEWQVRVNVNVVVHILGLVKKINTAELKDLGLCKKSADFSVKGSVVQNLNSNKSIFKRIQSK